MKGNMMLEIINDKIVVSLKKGTAGHFCHIFFTSGNMSILYIWDQRKEET